MQLHLEWRVKEGNCQLKAELFTVCMDQNGSKYAILKCIKASKN